MEVTIEFGKCLRGSFAALFQSFGSFLMLTIGWMVLAVAVFLATQGAVVAALRDWPEFHEIVAGWDEKAFELLLIAPLALVTIPGTISMVVGWHRRIIQGIVPQSPFPVGLWSILSYMGRGILAFGIPGLPLVLGLVGLHFIVPPEPDGPNAVRFVVVFAGIIAVGVVAMRLGVMLPAIAVGDRSMTVATAWRITKGNTLRLFFGAFLAALPFSIVGNIFNKAAEMPSVAESGWVHALLLTSGLIDMMSYAAVAGFFSLAYVQLREALDGAPIKDPLSVSA